MQDYTYCLMDFFHRVGPSQSIDRFKMSCFLATHGDKSFFGSWLDVASAVVVVHGASMLLLVQLSYLVFVAVVFLL